MRKASTLVMALSAVLAVGTLAAYAAGVKIGEKAPDFTLQDQSGKSVNLHDFAGKIVVLEWTNPKCPFVQRHYQAKTMLNLADQYKSKNVVWLAINSSSFATNDSNKQWADSQNIPYPVLNDADGTTGKAYHATNTPDMFIIAADGTVVYKGAIDNDPDGNKGSDAVNYVKQALDEITAGKPVSTPETKPYGCSVKYKD